MSELSGRVAVISGGLGDIGRAIALELARQGAKIALCDVANEAGLPEFLDALHKAAVPVTYDPVDVTDARGKEARANCVCRVVGRARSA